MAAKLKTETMRAQALQWDSYNNAWLVTLEGMSTVFTQNVVIDGLFYQGIYINEVKGRTYVPTPSDSKLGEVIALLASTKKVTWPIQAGKVDDFEFTHDGKGHFIKLDLTREAYTLIMKELNVSGPIASIAEKKAVAGIQISSSATLAWESLPVDFSHFIKGYVDDPETGVLDGDTIDVRVTNVGSAVRNITVGEVVRIRFVGVDAPETRKSYETVDSEYGTEKNTTFAKKYNVTVENAWSIADEAKNLTREVFKSAKGSVIVDLDTTAEGELVTTYGRYVGMVYKLPVTLDQALEGNLAVNMNKTLLSNHSKISNVVPLAMPSVTTNTEKTRFYDVQLWEYAIAAGKDERQKEIEAENEKYQAEREKMIADEREKIKYNNETTIVTKKTHIVSKDETLEGIAKSYQTTVDKILLANPSFTREELEKAAKTPGSTIDVPVIEAVSTSNNPAFDYNVTFSDGVDNSLDFFDALDDRREMESEFHLAIGDVQLIVPPLAIEVNRVSTLEKVKALRTKSSIMTKTASSQTAITLQLYFHDLDSINGYSVKVGSHDVYNDLAPADYRERTKDVVNDYYYMDGLRSLIAQFKKAPFLPVRNEYLNEVHEIWNVALVNLSVATVPGFPHSLSATLTLAKFELEAYMPQEVNLDELINYPMLRWYYQEVMNPKYANNPYRTYLAPIKGELTNDFYFELADEDLLKERQDAIKELRFMDSPSLFAEKLKEGDTELSKFAKDYARLQTCIAQQKNYLAIKAEYEGKGETLPIFGLGNNEALMQRIYSGDPDSDGMFFPYELQMGGAATTPRNGEYQIKVEAARNKGRIPSKYNQAGVYRLPATIDDPSVGVILENGKAIQLQADTYASQYNLLKQKAEDSEGSLTLNPYHISDMYITGMQVMYENNYAPLQVQSLDNPTMQYLGSQDPYIQVTFETTDRQAIQDMRHLLEEVERYSKEYRYGISSGFIGFRNQLSELFGVTTVMPESMRVSTVTGYANRFEIQLVLCGFDKTQKRTESLNGFSSTYSDVTLADRKKSEDPVANDVIVLERKMKDLEVYPDLELPTYAELNASLGTMNAGISLYHNPDGAKFVDPDFYISTKWTYRQYLMEERAQNHQLYMSDLSGLKGKVDSRSSDEDMKLDWTTINYFTPDEGSDFGYVLDTLDSYTQYMTTTDSGTGNGYAPNEAPATLSGKDAVIKGDDTTTTPTDVRQWASKNSNLIAKPSMQTWAKWNGYTVTSGEAVNVVKQAYDAYFAALKNPDPLEVYLEIYKNIFKTFVSNAMAVPNPNAEDPMNKLYGSVALKTSLKQGEYDDLTYMTIDDAYKVSYQYLVQTNPIFVGKSNNAKVDNKLVKKYTTLSEAIGGSGIPKITVERIANYVKALFHLRSGWQQFNSDGKGGSIPLLDNGNSGLGIGKLNPSLHATSVEMAQRLAWDWKYNLEYSVQYFFNQYVKAVLSADINIRCRPWDWAIRGYAQGSFTTYNTTNKTAAETYNGKLVTPDYQKFALIFEGSVSTTDYDQRKNALYNHPDADNASPGNPVNTEIYHYRYVNSSKEGQQMIAGADAVMFNPYTGTNMTAVLQNAGVLETTQLTILQKKESDRLLVSADDPRQLHRDMFTDMCEYDQRGRLIRAFPTFQMFIVDEGRWMTSYKLWDNLYGFNSIQSIDVYKTRKMAADTAIIKMTNVYSNLTSRTMDENYGDWSYSFWDNLFWGAPNESIIEARKELADSMMLKTGARLHLRLGYGSDAGKLPIVFNGTITEMDAQDVVTIIGQGDGIELSNIISADPNETNDKSWLPGGILEPRDLICELMTSRGNWFKDWVNNMTSGKLWGETSPLGIMHFGNPIIAPPATQWFKPWNANYGEAAQNIYSSNGANTFSQWEKADGTPFGWTWGEAGNPLPWPTGDEKNIEIKLEGKTVWDVVQTMAYCSADYIAAVLPFEMRSTLFFGKPYYKVAYRYDSAYKWVPANSSWERTVTSEIRKPYMQYHIFDSASDIISNQIRSSEEGVYTNVICTYEGGISDLQMADWDIRFDKQKTMTVQAPIVAKWARDFWTSKDQANTFAQSTLRDSLKDMYKGQLVMLGDPTVKPYDMCYMNDEMNTMNGTFQVKEVTHHFSYETGFITSVSPDAVVIIDDKVILSHLTWLSSAGKSFVAYMVGRKAAAAAVRKLVGSTAFLSGKRAGSASMRGLMKLSTYLPGGNDNVKLMQYYMRDLADVTKEISAVKGAVPTTLVARKEVASNGIEIAYKALSADIDALESKGVKKLGKMSLKTLRYTGENIAKGVKNGKTTVEFLRVAGTAATRSFVITAIAEVALTIVAETLAEMYRRKKKASQAVLLVPLSYQGRQLTSGINGHKGMVVGDSPGKWDKFFMGIGPYGGLGKTLNFLAEGTTASSVSFTTSYEDLNNKGLVDKAGGLAE